jgi:hypothetical protein
VPAEADAPQTCAPAGSPCVLLPTASAATTDGDWRGELVESVAGSARPLDDGSFRYTTAGVAVFSGTIEGCGSGTLTIASNADRSIGAAADDPADASSWWIVDGGGSGDLAEASGRGTFSGGITDAGFTSQYEGTFSCTGGAPGPTDESSTGGSSSTFTFDLPVAAAGTPTCTSDGAGCVASQGTTTELTGDWTGTAAIGVGVVAQPDEPSSVITDGLLVFDGEIAACGTGTVVLRRFVDLTIDPATFATGAELVETSSWRIVEGYGTGQLATVAGSGTVSTVSDGSSLTATYTGEVSCG